MKIDARSLYRAWRLAREAGRDLFRPGVGDELPKLTGWDACGLPSEGLAKEPSVTVLEALRALELHQQEQPPDLARVELVATLPGPRRQVAATRDVVRELIRGARRELLIVGFSITDHDFRELLYRRGVDGVRVTVVGDRTSGDVSELVRSWPVKAEPLVALRDAMPSRDEYRRMHGKVIVADRTRVLIGSANFSAGGLAGNIELGVRLEGAVAQEIHRTIEQLREEGWLVTVAA